MKDKSKIIRDSVTGLVGERVHAARELVGRIGRRNMTIPTGGVNESARTAELAFSSEAPVERYDWFDDRVFNEILSHEPGSVNMERLLDGAPYLVNHTTDDHVGVIQEARIDSDRRGRAKVLFSRSERGEEIFQDHVDGIRRHVSVGYMIDEIEEQKNGDIVVVRWTPLEISSASIPADISVGVNRALEPNSPKETEMNDKEKKRLEELEAAETKRQLDALTPPPEPELEVDIASVRADGEDAATKRAREIMEIAEAHSIPMSIVRDAIGSKKSVDGFRQVALDHLRNDDEALPKPDPSTERITNSDKDLDDFSFAAVLRAKVFPDDKQIQRAAGHSLELCAEAARRMHRAPNGIPFPMEALEHPRRDLLTLSRRTMNKAARDLTAAGGGDANLTFGTDVQGASFIEVLRNKSYAMTLGTVLTGLSQPIAIPRHETATQAYWVAESNAPTEGAPAFGQVTLSPKTCAAFVDFTRQLAIQTQITPGMEAFVVDDVTTALAVEIDETAWNGSGTGNEPTGILNTSGIGDEAATSNKPEWIDILNIIADVEVGNALIGRLAFMTSPGVKAWMMANEKTDANGNYIMTDPNNLAGFPIYSTNQMPTTFDTDKSVLLFGNYADLLMGFFGPLDVLVNPYSYDSTGIIRVTAFQDADIAVRHEVSFSAINDITGV